MRFQLPDGQIVLMDRPFSYAGVNYPAEWLRSSTPAEREAFGLLEVPEPEAPVTPAPPVVPHALTPLQARKAIRAAGLTALVDALLAAASAEVREEWDYALQIERHNPTLLLMADALGLTSAQLDALFIDGATR